MGEFFRGWKRKNGVVTLLMALLLSIGWVRSIDRREMVFFPAGTSQMQFISSRGGFSSCRVTNKNTATNHFDIGSSGWLSVSLPRPRATDDDLKEFLQRWRIAGFGICTWRRKNSEPLEIRTCEWIIPYWSIVIPLTLLSAYLLLSKPRKSIQKKIIEPIAVEGT